MSGYGGIIAQALLGAVGGAANAAGKVAEEDRKAETERIREERLSKLRMQEYVAKGDIDISRKKTDEAARADFYKRTEASAPGTQVSTPYTDAIGNEAEGESAGAATSTRKVPPSRAEIARFRLAEAQKTGDKELLTQAYLEDKDIRAEDEAKRKQTADEKRNDIAGRLAATKEQAAATQAALLEARIAGLIGGGRRGDGSGDDLKRDTFDEKRWNAAHKSIADNLVVDDGSGKTKPDFSARKIARGAMNHLKLSGKFDPEEAENLVGAAMSEQTAKADAFIASGKAKATDRETLIAAGVINDLSRRGVAFEGAKPEPKAKEPAKAEPAKAEPKDDKPKGIIASRLPDYVPPADSPAGQAAARRDAAKQEQSAKRQRMVEDAASKANSALASQSAEDAQATMDLPGFSELPLGTRTKINALAYGRR